MKKFLAIPISLILVASGLLAYDLYFKKFFETPKKTWDAEVTTITKNSMKIKGDIIVIEEELDQKQLQNGKGLRILDRKRAICSKSKNECVVEQWAGEEKGWQELFKCKLSDLLRGKPAPKPKTKNIPVNN